VGIKPKGNQRRVRATETVVMSVAQTILAVAAAYLACGFVFGVAFVTVGVGRVDPDARGTSVGFRLLILPGTTALWPLLAKRWAAASRGGGRG
jgi:hypothetical protein